jgi:hypothetical protein
LVGDCTLGALALSVEPSGPLLSLGVGATGVAGLALQAYMPAARTHTANRNRILRVIQLLQIVGKEGVERRLL